MQIGLITRDNGSDLGERQSTGDREYPLLTALNGPLMARRSGSRPVGGHGRPLIHPDLFIAADAQEATAVSLVGSL
ncbi:hypothetical protein Mro03_44930 [Microbispora rosea subsp. rosea]|nr:hypothetical protein Mro03_44930 [Microbispora rosea subsp. rosea]